MAKADPNIAERNQRALTVPCPYCKAVIQQPCWVLRNGNGPEHRTVVPHRSRIKTSWKVPKRKAGFGSEQDERNFLNSDVTRYYTTQ